MKQKEKSARAQKTITDTAMRLFFTKGFEATSMMDIAQEAGLSKGAIYHHFTSKQQIMELLTKTAAENVNARLWELADGNDLTAAQKITSIVELLVSSPENRSLAANNWAEKLPFAFLHSVRNTLNQIAVALGKILREGSDRGEYTCSYPEEIAMVLSLVFDLALDPMVVELTPQLVDSRLDFTAEMLRRFDAPIIDDTAFEKIRNAYKEALNYEQENK